MRHTFRITVTTDPKNADAPDAEQIRNEIQSNLEFSAHQVGIKKVEIDLLLSEEKSLVFGDKVNIKGYELAARILYADGNGEVFVVHNNSSHYLVLSCDEARIYEEPDWDVMFEEAYRYFGEEDPIEVFRLALASAAKKASTR